jgi:uncharacterized protein YPO0396
VISFNDIEIARLRQQLASENTRLIELIRTGSHTQITAQKAVLKQIVDKINELQGVKPPPTQ